MRSTLFAARVDFVSFNPVMTGVVNVPTVVILVEPAHAVRSVPFNCHAEAFQYHVLPP